MMYGNRSEGFAYSPDRRNDRVDHYNNRSQFIGANGNRQYGYYGESTSYYAQKKSGYYDGAGRYHED
jgi:hypothetical protein